MKLLITIPRQGVLFHSFIGEDTIELLQKHFDVIFNESTENYTPESLKTAAEGVDVLMTGWGTPSLVEAGLLEKGTNLKLLVHTGGSVGDLVDNTAYENGVKVISGNSMFAESTAEGAFTYILTALRRLPDDIMRMRDGDYWSSPYLTKGLFEREVGIIGVGSVSRNLMRFMKPFRVKLKVYDTYDVDREFLSEVGAEQVSFEEAMGCSVVSVHAALGPKTQGMIGKEQLKLIRDGALFVNTSRGAIIDEEALAEELASGRFNAILDVYTSEPLSPCSPLRKMDNVYLVPHKAGPTNDLRRIIGYNVAEDAVRFAEGEPLKFEIDSASASRMTRHS